MRGLDYYSETCFEFVESGSRPNAPLASSRSVPLTAFAADSSSSTASTLISGTDLASSKPSAKLAVLPLATTLSPKGGASLGASQTAVLAGGRYDTLALSLGHKTAVPAIGYRPHQTDSDLVFLLST